LTSNRNLTKEVSEFWNEVSTRKLSSEEMLDRIRSIAQIAVVSIHINHACNLRCKHCFYGSEKSFEKELSAKEWFSIIDQFLDMGVRHFHICGREPFLNGKLLQVLIYLNRIKKKTEINYGVITNGILFKDFADDICDLNMNYLDFSIDGTKEYHEFLRGKNTFNRTLEGLKLAIDNNCANIIYVSSVAHKNNYKNLPTIIEMLHSLGIRSFFIQPMLLFGRARNLKDLLISTKEFNELIHSCNKTVAKLNPANPLYLELQIYPTMLPYLYKNNGLVKAGLDKYLKEYTSKMQIGNSTISFRFHLSCLAYWRYVQITADGYYIGCDMMLTALDYRKFAIGNVKEEKISLLYRKSLQNDSFLGKICSSHENCICRNINCFEKR
jgi:MoaA/NifB/PqqE/SkfB family radical SAM enzyme